MLVLSRELSMDAAERVSRDRIKEPDAGLAQPAPSSSPPGRRRLWRWIVGVPLALLLILVLVAAFIDEPLRAYAERQLNSRVDGYTFHIGKLDFHPIGLSIDFENVTVVQTDHPDPPIAQLT